MPQHRLAGLLVITSVLSLTACSGPQSPRDPATAVTAARHAETSSATTGGVQNYNSLPERLEAFVAAINSGDDAMSAFYADGVTESFRTRGSQKADRAMYQRLHSDLGNIEIAQLMRRSPEEVSMLVRSERSNMPVEFLISVADERIDGFRVNVGGPPGGPETTGVSLSIPVQIDDDDLSDVLHPQLTELAANEQFSGVVLIARKGVPVFHRAYGLADRATGRRNTTDTTFDIGSITKFLTHIAVAQLLQKGSLSLEATISDYLPGYPDRDIAKKVTIQQLLDHSSGLGDFFGPKWDASDKDRYIEPQDFFPLFTGQPLLFEPGTSNAYSNAGFVVLGAIIAAVTSQPYADYIQTHIFSPAGMTRSGFTLRNGDDQTQAIGYTTVDPTQDPVANFRRLPVKGCPAGSSMHTAADLLKLDRALRSGKLVDRKWTAWLYRSADTSPGARYAIGIAGGGEGVNAGLESDGELAVIVLANQDPPIAEVLSRKLAQALPGAAN